MATIVRALWLAAEARFSFIIWLATRAGKMTQIMRCDWLPERARWSHLARSGLPAVSRKQNLTKSRIISPLLTKFAWSRWLDIGLLRFCASLWTSTSSWSTNTQKKELAQYPAILTSHLVNNPYVLIKIWHRYQSANRKDQSKSFIFLMYSIFSNRNPMSLFSCKAYDKLITMTEKMVGYPCSLVRNANVRNNLNIPFSLYPGCTGLEPRPRCFSWRQNSYFGLLRKLIRQK